MRRRRLHRSRSLRHSLPALPAMVFVVWGSRVRPPRVPPAWFKEESGGADLGSVRVRLQVSSSYDTDTVCTMHAQPYRAASRVPCKRPRIMQTAGWAPLFPQPNRCLTGAAGPCPSPGRTAGWTIRRRRRLCAFCDTLGNPFRTGSPDSPRVIIKSLHLEVVVFGRSSTSASKIMTVGSQCAISSRYHLACSSTPLACRISHAQEGSRSREHVRRRGLTLRTMHPRQPSNVPYTWNSGRKELDGERTRYAPVRGVCANPVAPAALQRGRAHAPTKPPIPRTLA